MKPVEISCYEQELEYFLQINLYCSEEQLRCWNVSQFLEGLGVIRAVFFIVSSKPETCYEGCICVSHRKNVEAQLNIYDLSYDKYREQGIDISRVLSSIGIHHTMKDVPIVKTDNLILDLQLQSAFPVINHYQTFVQPSPAYRFRTSTPIPDSLPSLDSISKLQYDCPEGEENFSKAQLSDPQVCLHPENQLSPEDQQEVNQCCEDMLDILSQQENFSFRSLDDLNLSGYFSFGNSSRSVQVAQNFSENNSLLQMTGFTSVLENFQMKTEKAHPPRTLLDGKPSVLPKIRGGERFAYERFAKGLAYENDNTRLNKQAKPLCSDPLADESDCSTGGLESEYSGNMKTPQSSFPRLSHPHELSNHYSGRNSTGRTLKRQAVAENSETFEDSNKSYDEVFIRRRVSRGKNLEVKGTKVVVTQCNYMGCHHVVSSPRSELRKALLAHVEDHIEDAVPCPTANCPSSEKSFINIREHLRVFHEFDRNCIEALLKRSNRRRMRELTIKCFPNKFF